MQEFTLGQLESLAAERAVFVILSALFSHCAFMAPKQFPGPEHEIARPAGKLRLRRRCFHGCGASCVLLEDDAG